MAVARQMGVQIVYASLTLCISLCLFLCLTPVGAIINKLTQAVTDAFNLLLELFMTNDWARNGMGREWSVERVGMIEKPLLLSLLEQTSQQQQQWQQAKRGATVAANCMRRAHFWFGFTKLI